MAFCQFIAILFLFSISYSHQEGQFHNFKVIKGDANSLPLKVQEFLKTNAELCQPDNIYICDGSEQEAKEIAEQMEKDKLLIRLPKYENSWLVRTHPDDLARVESRTYTCTTNKREAVPDKNPNATSKLGYWMSPADLNKTISNLFPGSMKGRTMYLIGFSMGLLESPLSKLGVEVTDSGYAVLSMRIMTVMGTKVFEKLAKTDDFVRALHTVGTPESGKQALSHWPCDPERHIVVQKPDTNEIVSYGSGYGCNSFLGKKCFALRIGSYLAKKEGWLAEHMLIVGVENAEGKKHYIAGAFPSSCGKTNLAMMTPTLPGYKITTVGDDIAWMKFNEKGELRAINPESGFYGVAPGTSNKTNPNAMRTIIKNTIFTNVATTSDGGVFWEGLEDEIPKDVTITDWQGKEWKFGSKTPAAHPNSRYCAPTKQCPILDPGYNDPEGVKIDAILFGGRRPVGIPLVYESLNWTHGVFVGTSVRSEATAAAEHKGKVIMNDPFAMRPFFGYNFGHYLRHWLDIGKRPNVQLPKIFHVNWFRKDSDGKFLWPGYGENSRVLDWIFQRLEKKTGIAKETAIGYIPTKEALRTDGLKTEINYDKLFEIDKVFLLDEVDEVTDFLEEQLGSDLPEEIVDEAEEQRNRLILLHYPCVLRNLTTHAVIV